MQPAIAQQEAVGTEPPPGVWARGVVDLLVPLIGIRGYFDGQALELIDVLSEGPQVALLDASSAPRIQANQYGDPLTRQSRVLTLPVVSAVEPDAHPALRALLPEAILEELRQRIGDHVRAN